MQRSEVAFDAGRFGGQSPAQHGRRQRLAWVAAWFAMVLSVNRLQADPANSDSSDPLLDLFIQKGFITQSEADKARAEIAAMRTNEVSQLPAEPSRFKLSDDVKSLEFFGDVKMRYEDRTSVGPASTPEGISISRVRVNYQRSRYALHLGVRGEAFDDFYFGFRLETAENPRSPWVTLGQSTAGSPVEGPYGKSEGGVNVGQIYLGWRPESWFDLTVGKMPNPLYTTSMVWDPDLNPEGLAENFKAKVGEADFYATFGQFVYSDQNPAYESAGLGGLSANISNENALYMLTWSGGVIYHVTTNITARVGANFYQYYGEQASSVAGGQEGSPYFGDTYVGEGAYFGQGSPNNPIGTFPPSAYNIYGASGYGNNNVTPGSQSVNYPNNQVGINDLRVVEVPFEVDFTLLKDKLNARIFGDVAYNLDGAGRAQAAQSAYSYYVSQQNPPLVTVFPAQLNDDKAYQFGVAVGNKNSLGMVYTGEAPRHAWEARVFWQHIEQYALDPNLIDSDFFEGAENLQGVYTAFAYAFTYDFVGTFRYGYASRINDLLGTGGSDQDIPQVNPIDKYQIFQIDLSYKF